ncbi:choline kinase 2 [Pyrus ussuriensis x Pyrus communis]|uniref:Choline kinase 2 n=1 Tax=Pyrus ussuriensis x Pyrus communis TaxID=2448454 RepID=A0A5N5EXV3_9ROSA|nr:choline kinase 2 [Pyrus ussuriensis x Pyrus communis]
MLFAQNLSLLKANGPNSSANSPVLESQNITNKTTTLHSRFNSTAIPFLPETARRRGSPALITHIPSPLLVLFLSSASPGPAVRFSFLSRIRVGIPFPPIPAIVLCLATGNWWERKGTGLLRSLDRNGVLIMPPFYLSAYLLADYCNGVRNFVIISNLTAIG